MGDRQPHRTDHLDIDLGARAGETGRITRLLVVVEPTGIYHKLLLRIAASLGFETALVDAGHVKKMRVVLFGDDGKTDQRETAPGISTRPRSRRCPATRR